MSGDFEVSGFPSAWGKLRFLKYLYAMGLHMPLLTELKNLLAGATTNMSHLRRFGPVPAICFQLAAGMEAPAG